MFSGVNKSTGLKPQINQLWFGDQVMTKFVSRFLKDESGATAIEYGLIAALIAVAAIAAMQGLGNQLKTTFNTTSSSMVVPAPAA